MRIDRVWSVFDLILGLSLGVGIGLHYAMTLGGFDIYIWIASLMCVGGAHTMLARAVLDALGPSKDRTRVPYTLLRFAAFILAAIYLYATAYLSFGIIDTRAGRVSTSMIDALYLSAVTWTTVGYGDLIPNGPVGRFIAAVEALDAYLVMAVFISCLVPGLVGEAARYRLRERAITRRYLMRSRAKARPKGEEDSGAS